MKKLLLFLALATVATAQPIIRSGWTTNTEAVVSGKLFQGVVFVDAISGNDTNTGTILQPVATLTKGQTLATNGNTVYALRGTFNEPFLGKSGVDWFFSKGVTLSGAPNFLVGASNGVTSLNVFGQATITNDIAAFFAASNCTVNVECDVFTPASLGAAVYEMTDGLSPSNTFVLKARKIERGYAIRSAIGAVSNDVYAITLQCSESMSLNPSQGSSSGNTNKWITLKAPKISASANFYGATLNRVQTQADWFTRGSFTINAVQSNYVWNASVISTNDLNTGLSAVWRGRVTVLTP